MVSRGKEIPQSISHGRCHPLSLPTFAVVRPGWFHSSYLPPVARDFCPGLLESGTLVPSFEPAARFPHVVVQDMGRLGAMALLDPAGSDWQEAESGSENFGIEDVADALSKAMGPACRAEGTRGHGRRRYLPDRGVAVLRWCCGPHG